jgi:valyl-tRNA synthetase
MIPEKLLKPYDPKETEGRTYEIWEESGSFAPNPEGDGYFSIIMPPPNANGRLHVGHALTMALQDIMIRFNRMKGKKTLWVPGADHAGFETQIVYEKKLEKEGRSRFDMKPEDLYKEIYDFTIENKAHMESDVRRIGASCDWSKEKFTLDPIIVEKVQETFRKMFKDNLIYRGKRIINWCARHQTSLSDVETEFKEQKDTFYYLKYGPFTIATARPETKFGDKYVVMHPDDKRYSGYKHGQKIDLEWINGPITATVIKDDAIDMEFGTGVMTITPWHDQTDFEIAERHNLDKEQIIDFKGKLLPIAGEFAGQHISKARAGIIEKFTEKGLVEKIDENYIHNVKCCYKCNTVIEPQIKDQWFIKMKPLAKLSLDAYRKKEIEFIPESQGKVFEYFMENTVDWNISRQIIWGIPIPAYICSACKEGSLDTDDHDVCKKCGGEMIKDADTFDTWFSSGQWPLLCLEYPENTELMKYHPTSVMETGRDLIFKWIPRMVIFSLYLRNEIPFKTVYLNGLVNDSKGQKMSKSKGNVVSPIDMIDKYGSDAMRMGLVVGNSPGMDTAMLEDKIKGYRNFANKLWNISRFILTACEGAPAFDPDFDSTDADKKLSQDQCDFTKEITKELEEYKLHIVAEKLYHFAWHTLADVILEESKTIFASGDEKTIASRKNYLLGTLQGLLTMLHPFMPFVTEELWSLMPWDKDYKGKLLMISKWPQV